MSACNFIKKETLTQVFSCEFFEISNNNFSYRTVPVAASKYRRKLWKEARRLHEEEDKIAYLNYRSIVVRSKSIEFVLLSAEESFFDNEHVFLIINSFSKQSLSILHLNI